MAALNRNVLQVKRPSIGNETTMGDEEQLLMERIEGSEKELQTIVGTGTEVSADKGSQKELRCHYCNKVFYKQKNLKVHLCIHTGEKKLQCNICGKCFIQSCHLKRHLRSHSGEKPYSCDICGNQFSQNGHLRVHLKSHFGNKNYKCEYCPMAFVQNSHLKRHMRSHMTIRPYKCDMCDKTYKFSDHLYIHLRRHTGETPYHCTFCDKAFHTSANLNAHVKIHNKYVDRKFKCQVCVKKFHTNYALVKHMAVHTSDTPFSCRLCSKSFKYKGNLKHHFDVHSNDADMKLLKCVICVKRCTSFQSLKDHMLSHYEETCKTHRCEICNKNFRIKSSLQMHHSLHTGLKLAYRCIEEPCQFESKTVDEMKDHSTLHHVRVEDGSQEDTSDDNLMTSYNEMEENVSGTVRKFKCPMGCSHSFDNIADLVSHLKCHIKLEKTQKSIDHPYDHSSVARVSDSGAKETGVCRNTIDIHSDSFPVQNVRQGKSTAQLDPVSMLIETAEQVLPRYYDQAATGDQIQVEPNEERADRLLRINHQPAEKRQMLIGDHSNYLQGVGTNTEERFVSDRPFSTSPSTENETVSFSIILPEMSKSRELQEHRIPVLVQTLPCLSDDRRGTEHVLQDTQPPSSTITQPFRSRGSSVGEHHTSSSTAGISGTSCQTHDIGGSHSNGVVRENDASWVDSAVTNRPFTIEGNGNQSLVIGGHVIRMLDSSDVSISSESVQLQGENIQEIVVDERTMHELVIGTSEVPFSVGVDARFHHHGQDTNYEHLSVEEVEEVIIPTKQKEDATDHVLYSDKCGTDMLDKTSHTELTHSSSSFASPVGPKGKSISGTSRVRGQQNFISNAILQETNGTKLQYVPYSTENSVFIDSIGDHRYVLSHGEHSMVTCKDKVIEGQEQVLEDITGTQDITKHSGYSPNSPRAPQLDSIDIRDVAMVRCPFCNEHFQDNNVLIDHLQSHMTSSEKIVVNVVMYMCHLCDVEFNSREGLKAHLQTHV